MKFPESRENDFDASFRARATPFTTRDAPENRLDPSARLGQGFRTQRIASRALLCSSNRVRARSPPTRCR